MATFLSELAITTLDHPLDIFDLHFSRPISDLAGIFQVTLR